MSTKPNSNAAYSQALALESIPEGATYDKVADTFEITAKELEQFARIVAYKTASNLANGFHMDEHADPLNYIDCEDNYEQ